MHAFEGRPDAAEDPRIDLLGWTDEQLRAMPPTLVITDERDVLRSQGQEFATRLEAAGVPVSQAYFPGAMHEFFGASAVFELAEQAQQDAARHLAQAFGTSVGSTGASGTTVTAAPASPPSTTWRSGERQVSRPAGAGDPVGSTEDDRTAHDAESNASSTVRAPLPQSSTGRGGRRCGSRSVAERDTRHDW